MNKSTFYRYDTLHETKHDKLVRLQYSILNDKNKAYRYFIDKMSWLESKHDWKNCNGQYIGKYQISRIALKDVGVKISIERFKKNPYTFSNKKQEKVIKLVIDKNRWYLRDYIKKYCNTYVNDILITESGLVAGAHLVGQDRVKYWLNHKGKRKVTDGNGVNVEKYIVLFTEYELNEKN